MSAFNGNDSQLTVKLFTKNQKLSIPDNPFSLSSKSTSEEFSSLIKSILLEQLENEKELPNDEIETLKNEVETIEFDFYINEKIIDSSLDEFVQLNSSIRTESIIDIEYVERNPPPNPVDSIITEDWVSSIRGFNQNCILLGSYDNSVQLWNTSSECLTKLSGHTGAVKEVAWISTFENNNKHKIFKFLSCSNDQSILIWEWNKNKNKVEKIEKCIGHSESVECVHVNTENSKFISGSWDKMLKLWNLGDDDSAFEETTNKKSKSDLKTTNKTPIITLAGHTESISSCKWIDDKNVCTASWDYSIKLWDVFIGQETRTLKSLNKIFLSIDYSNLNNLIVSGLNDNFIRIYDSRSKEGNIVKITLSSHSGWCTSVFWSKTNPYNLISGSHDNTAKLWDIRNNKQALFDMLGHEDKVLCVDWSLSEFILTGSADNTFKIFSTLKV